MDYFIITDTEFYVLNLMQISDKKLLSDNCIKTSKMKLIHPQIMML